MRVAVLGAGMTGLTAALRLGQDGHQCDVYERWPGLGGQVATLDIGAGDPLERYYHHLFTSDVHIQALYEELGLHDGLEWLDSSVAVFRNGVSHPFTTPTDLLRFKPLSPIGRIRVGLSVLWLQVRHGKDVSPFENMTAQEWISRVMGSSAWDSIWGPLLRGKFGNRAGDISMAWIWSKLTLRRQVKGSDVRGETLGYPTGGWQPLLDKLARQIESDGGRVLIDRPATRIERNEEGIEVRSGAPGSFRRGLDPRAFEELPETQTYDFVVATVPGDIFIDLMGPVLREQVGAAYIERVESIDYHTAVCLLLELDRSFTPFYWTNIAEAGIPFVGLIEQTNMVPVERYGGRRFLYVANYVEPDSPLIDMDADQLLAHYEAGLQAVNTSFGLDWVKERWIFKEPAAQPIVTIGYQDRIPALQTPAEGLLLANTTQIYPEDRGTNYSVRLGTDVASLVPAVSPG